MKSCNPANTTQIQGGTDSSLRLYLCVDECTYERPGKEIKMVKTRKMSSTLETYPISYYTCAVLVAS